MAYLPGQSRRLDAGSHETCEECGQPATHAIVGEVDSFGHEDWFYCEEHYNQRKEALSNADRSGHCDHCGSFSAELSYRRDPDEGLSGPVYRLCPECIRKQNEYFND